LAAICRQLRLPTAKGRNRDRVIGRARPGC
jgi:hypothetical protein